MTERKRYFLLLTFTVRRLSGEALFHTQEGLGKRSFLQRDDTEQILVSYPKADGTQHINEKLMLCCYSEMTTAICGKEGKWIKTTSTQLRESAYSWLYLAMFVVISRLQLAFFIYFIYRFFSSCQVIYGMRKSTGITRGKILQQE